MNESFSSDQTVRYEQFPSELGWTGPKLTGKWKQLPIEDGYIRLGRIYQGRTTQFITARFRDEAVDGLMALEPPDLPDDGDWTISKNPGSGYAITSGFAISYGPFEWQSAMNDWLPVYGMALTSVVGYVQGEAYFSELESGCFKDALLRLLWLESFCVSVNRQVEKSCRRMWSWLDEKCRPDIAKMLLDPEEIVFPPELFELMHPRTRERRGT